MAWKKKIVIRGVEYESFTAAGRALGVTRNAIAMAHKRGTLETVGLSARGQHHGVKLVIDGKTYPSIVEASRQTGISYHTLYDTFRRGQAKKAA